MQMGIMRGANALADLDWETGACFACWRQVEI